MTLSQTILDAARETCAHKRNVDSYETLKHHFTINGLTETLSDFETEAALLAMDRRAEFLHWIFREESPYILTGGKIYNWAMEDGIELTELELFEIWEGQRNG